MSRLRFLPEHSSRAPGTRRGRLHRPFLAALAIPFAALFAFAVPARAAAPDPNAPPNVVMIVSDDQGWIDYGFEGHPAIRTPHLDRLAKESALFRHGYVTAPLCRPSLASLITGLHPHRHMQVGNDPSGPKGNAAAYSALREKLIAHIDRVPTLPKLLGRKGYLSLETGKWWEGNYKRGGFTHGMTRGFPQPGGRHGDDGLTIGRQGLAPVFDFIRTAKDEHKPFFVWYAPMMPHTPHNPPPQLLEKYLEGGKVPRADAAYRAMCEWFDQTCGDLLKHLDEQGLRENTLVVYVTDNGWKQEADSPLHDGKRSPYDGGIRTPVMLRWPGRIVPGDYPETVSSIDLVPTGLAACGLEPTPQMHGVNLLGLVGTNATDASRKQVRDRDTVFGAAYEHDVQDLEDPAQSLRFRYAIENGRWKLIAPKLEPRGELYDLAADPHETKDVSAAHPEIVARLAKKIDAWWAEP